MANVDTEGWNLGPNPRSFEPSRTHEIGLVAPVRLSTATSTNNASPNAGSCSAASTVEAADSSLSLSTLRTTVDDVVAVLDGMRMAGRRSRMPGLQHAPVAVRHTLAACIRPRLASREASSKVGTLAPGTDEFPFCRSSPASERGASRFRRKR